MPRRERLRRREGISTDARDREISAVASRQTIFLRADQDVPFGAFATVMDAVKQSGITNVSIVTQPLQEHGSKR